MCGDTKLVWRYHTKNIRTCKICCLQYAKKMLSLIPLWSRPEIARGLSLYTFKAFLKGLQHTSPLIQEKRRFVSKTCPHSYVKSDLPHSSMQLADLFWGHSLFFSCQQNIFNNNISICMAPFARGYKALLPIITASGKSSQSFSFT